MVYSFIFPSFGHGSSLVSQLLLPILYIVLFLPCWNRNLLIDEILQKNVFFPIFRRKEILFSRCEFDTIWQIPFLFILRLILIEKELKTGFHHNHIIYSEAIPRVLTKKKQKRIVFFNTHSLFLLVNNPRNRIYILLPRRNEIFKWFFIEWLFIYLF